VISLAVAAAGWVGVGSPGDYAARQFLPLPRHDHCPTCRGVWLDRGELDKIIEMSQSVPVPAGPRGDARPAQSERDSRAHRDNERYDDRGDYDDEHDPRRRKRKSMLGELFDF
jgi:Zn-finger nucleic acid-binding protein